MANTPKCITPKCTANALNTTVSLKSGGVARCPYCPEHAAARDIFILGGSAATPTIAPAVTPAAPAAPKP